MVKIVAGHSIRHVLHHMVTVLAKCDTSLRFVGTVSSLAGRPRTATYVSTSGCTRLDDCSEMAYPRQDPTLWSDDGPIALLGLFGLDETWGSAVGHEEVIARYGPKPGQRYWLKPPCLLLSTKGGDAGMTMAAPRK